MLTIEKEIMLIKRYQTKKCSTAAGELIASHQGFIEKITHKYDGYGLPFSDMLQQAHVGYLMGIARFDTSFECRLNTIARHYVESELRNYAIANTRVGKVATTKPHRKLFFQLRKLQSTLTGMSKHEQFGKIATLLDVNVADVIEMDKRLNIPAIPYSTIESYSDEDQERAALVLHSAQDVEDAVMVHQSAKVAKDVIDNALKCLTTKNQVVFKERLLIDEPKKLQELADYYGVKKQRIYQMEKESFSKVSKHVTEALV